MRAIIHDNQWIYFDNITDAEDAILWEEFSVARPGTYIDPNQAGNWDGIFRKYNRGKRRMARPFLSMLRGVCQKRGLPLSVVDQREPWSYEIVPVDQIGPDFLPGITLEDYQVKCIQKLTQVECGIVDVPTGGGKCLGEDVKVLMYDMSTKLAKDVIIGDLLMGDDNSPRRVLSICSGFGELYEVRQKNGDNYVVNSEHILSLMRTPDGKSPKMDYKVVDVPVSDYCGSSKKHLLKGYKASTEHKATSTAFDPYAFGVWLGDGISADCTYALNDTTDKPIIDYLCNLAKSLGLELVKHENLRYLKEMNCEEPSRRIDYYSLRLCEDIHKPDRIECSGENPVKNLDLFDNKHIPTEYLMNSRAIRLAVLAGFIDADGHINDRNDILYATIKRGRLVDDVAKLARSLGFKVTVSDGWKTHDGINGDWYKRITISGQLDEIPLLVTHKSVKKRLSKKSPLVCGIKVVPIGPGNYFGFQLDGNKRFLLADFTVTHNSELISGCCKAIPCPTLVLADQRIVIDQLKARLELRDVASEVGLFYAGRRPSGQLIVVGTIQSLSPPGSPPEVPSQNPGEEDEKFALRVEKWEKKFKAYKTRKANAKVLQQYVKQAEMIIVDECVHEDTWIATDVGFERAAEVVERLNSKELVQARVGGYYYPITSWQEKIAPTINITTNTSASIRVSHNHLCATFVGGGRVDKHAIDIKPGDLLLAPRPVVVAKIDYKWYHLGLFMGDGHFLSYDSIRFAVRKDVADWRATTIAIAAQWNGTLKSGFNKRGDFVAVIKSIELCDWLRSLGFNPGRKMGSVDPRFSIPNLDAAAGLLRGLFDAEGSSYPSSVTCDSVDLALMGFAQKLMAYLGIGSSVFLSNKRTNIKHVKLWRVAVSGANARKWRQIVGFGFARKKARLAVDSTVDSERHIDPRPWLSIWRAAGLPALKISRTIGVSSSDISLSRQNKISLSRLIDWQTKIDALVSITPDNYNSAKNLFGISDQKIGKACGLDAKTVWNRRQRGDDSLWQQYVLTIKEKLREQRIDTTLTDYAVEVVKSTESAGQARLIDLTVPGPASFEANGFLVHNCDKAASDPWRNLFRHHFLGRRRYGFSGTPTDPDKPVEAMVMQEHLGSVVFRETRANLTKLGRIIPCEYYMMAYGLDGSISESSAYDIAYNEHITNSPTFHHMVAKLCKKSKKEEGDGTLVLVDREALGWQLEAAIRNLGLTANFIFGKTPQKKRDQQLRAFERREFDVLIGGKIINRGLDLSGGCETLIIATGGKLQSGFIQQIGRALRRNRRGKSKIYDYFFRCNKYLYSHSKARLKTMVSAGYPCTVVFPGGGISGVDLLKSRFQIKKKLLIPKQRLD